MKYSISLFLSITLLIIFCFNSKQKNKKRVLYGEVFGSYFSIVYFDDLDLEPQIDSIYRSIDKSLSTCRVDSEISIWNSGNDSINLSENFIKVAKISLKVLAKF